jgi:DNA-binding response OmpR family regulator
MRVLVVDDDRIGARMVEFLLSEQGYTVVTAESADAALVEIEQQLPDLLLLDVNLPEINGFELYTQLRDRGLDIPVIFLTAKGEIDDRVQGLTMGADDYIAKPFQPAELAARIQAVLRRYQRASGPLGQACRLADADRDEAARLPCAPPRPGRYPRRGAGGCLGR